MRNYFAAVSQPLFGNFFVTKVTEKEDATYNLRRLNHMKTFITIIILAHSLIFVGCGPSSSHEPRALDAQNFETKLQEEKDEIILDVRTPEEFASGHMAGAILMNVKDDDFRDNIQTLDTSKAIFVYCSAGVRSAKAASVLAESGFDKVYQLENGLKAWNEAGKDLVK